MKLIIGLGNPGRIYENNRHNIGFMCVNHFARLHGVKFDRKEGKSRTGSGVVAGNSVVLAKPQTYMNNSGDSVKRLLARYKLTPEDLLVIHDDLDLSPGKIRIRQGSSSGGHKGVESIIAFLGSQDFLRLRVGIGRPEAEPSSSFTEDEVINYVLSDFTPEEKKVISEVIPRVSEAIICLLEEGLIEAMNRYN
jgi:PTH1 family peptidyl-tRNA hydrolase